MADSWPLLMDLPTACRFTTHTRSQFRAMIMAGLFPPGRFMPHGKELWHRGELEKAADRLWDLEAKVSLERAREEARLAMAAVRPRPRRHKQQQPG